MVLKSKGLNIAKDTAAPWCKPVPSATSLEMIGLLTSVTCSENYPRGLFAKPSSALR